MVAVDTTEVIDPRACSAAVPALFWLGTRGGGGGGGGIVAAPADAWEAAVVEEGCPVWEGTREGCSKRADMRSIVAFWKALRSDLSDSCSSWCCRSFSAFASW